MIVKRILLVRGRNRKVSLKASIKKRLKKKVKQKKQKVEKCLILRKQMLRRKKPVVIHKLQTKWARIFWKAPSRNIRTYEGAL